MTKKFEKELNKIVRLYGKARHKDSLKTSILNLLKLYESGDLDDESIDKSHISEHQTDIFQAGA